MTLVDKKTVEICKDFFLHQYQKKVQNKIFTAPSVITQKQATIYIGSGKTTENYK